MIRPVYPAISPAHPNIMRPPKNQVLKRNVRMVFAIKKRAKYAQKKAFAPRLG